MRAAPPRQHAPPGDRSRCANVDPVGSAIGNDASTAMVRATGSGASTTVHGVASDASDDGGYRPGLEKTVAEALMSYLCAAADRIPAGCRIAVSGRDLSVLSATGQQEIFWTNEIAMLVTRLFSSDQFQKSLAKIALLTEARLA